MRRLARHTFTCVAPASQTAAIFAKTTATEVVSIRACWLRCFSTTPSRHAPKRAVSARPAKSATAPRGRPPNSTQRSNAASGAATSYRQDKAAEKQKGAGTPVDLDEEERRLMEGDTRLAMRLLMQHHFLYQNNVRRPEEQREEEERQRLREKHRARMERIERKTRNSMELGPDVSVDGILPLYRRPNSTATATATTTETAALPLSKPRPAASWMRLNPVEAEAGDAEGGDYDNTGSSSSSGIGHLESLLMKPDISAYDAAHDQRIRSAEVLDEEQRRRREELKSGDAIAKLWSREELETGGGLSPQRVVQSQLLEDEDEDFAVEAYANASDE
ncbi:hypothetical protein DQ04_16181010 [Trypanosoma grayi]|uniref:hypothetical protein n=1 Tax=Trypanosoma grayi TaxID=71804 RepID=UPI0004F49E8E|nr:hypothetical protein DQ04_16181010 [Trypanosoma grayi]KEG06062.1 hypothetical protein DQ04_16181010 [Trypanosoma grayi]